MSKEYPKKTKNIKVKKDFIYTILATSVGSAALQLIVYPVVAREFGIDTLGEILFFIGIIYIVPQAFGNSLANTRLLVRKDCESTNGDYNSHILAGIIVSFLACGVVGFAVTGNLPFCIMYGLFAILYMLKVYAGVEFRLVLNLKGYFIYYLITAIGYLAGLGLYYLTNNWLLIFAIGEGAALVYVAMAGNIFKKEKKNAPPNVVKKTVATFLYTTFIRDGVLQFDKVILMQMLSATAVAQYNAISVVAKTMQVFVNPIVNFMLTYMTRKGWQLTRKINNIIVFGCIGFGAVFYVLSILVAPLYVRLFYPTLYDAVIQYNLMINLGLILWFVSSLVMTVLVSQGELKVFTVVQTIWGLSYIIVVYLAVMSHGLWGLACAMVAVNSGRVGVVLVLAAYKARNYPVRNTTDE